MTIAVANLEEAYFAVANLEEAYFAVANLEEAYFAVAKMLTYSSSVMGILTTVQIKVGGFVILWSVIVGVVAILFCLVWYSMVHISVDFSRSHGDDEGYIQIRCLFGLIRYKKSLIKMETEMTSSGPLLHLEHLSDANSTDREHKQVSASDVWGVVLHLREWSHKLKQIRPIVLRLWARVHVTQLQVNVSIGVGDAISTGMAVGSSWAIINAVLGRASKNFRFDRLPEITIEPNFQQTVFNLHVHGIMRVRAGHAISAAIGVVRVWKRRTFDGAPNSRSHADSHG